MMLGMPVETVSAGYFGVVPGPPPSWLDRRYVGEALVSLSRELVAMVPGPAWTTSSPEAELLDVGVPRDALAAAAAWIEAAADRGEVLFPNVYRQPSLLQDFLARFAPRSPVKVLGAALNANQVDAFLAAHDDEIGQADGVVEMLRYGEPLAAGHRVLGYEPVEVTWGGFGSSWTVHRLQPAVELATGVIPNHDGFIATPDDARTVMSYLAQPEVGKDPGLWRAWLVVSYST
jgi:hypothetical protein